MHDQLAGLFFYLLFNGRIVIGGHDIFLVFWIGLHDLWFLFFFFMAITRKESLYNQMIDEILYGLV
jgi:hypothetical protein